MPDEDDRAYLVCLHCGYADDGRDRSTDGQIREAWLEDVRRGTRRRSGGRKRRLSARRRVRLVRWYQRWGTGE